MPSAKTTKNPVWISCQQAAVHFGVSKDKLYRMAEREEIPFIRLGQARNAPIRFNVNVLEDLFRQWAGELSA